MKNNEEEYHVVYLKEINSTLCKHFSSIDKMFVDIKEIKNKTDNNNSEKEVRKKKRGEMITLTVLEHCTTCERLKNNSLNMPLKQINECSSE
ncbi:MAG: hypothetical protein V2A54_11065 [Bacteroidota bacterium]